MKAVAQDTFGDPADVLRLTDDAPEPVAGPGEVVVDVAAASINALDWVWATGRPGFARLVTLGLRTPKRRIAGADVAGAVRAVGEGVTRWRVGDLVFGSSDRGGSFAERVAVKQDELATLPDGADPGLAATLGVAALTALQGLRDWARLTPGQSVLVIGASGGVGSFAVQVA